MQTKKIARIGRIIKKFLAGEKKDFLRIRCNRDRDLVWPDLAQFCNLGKNLKVSGHFLKVYLVIPEILSLLGQSLHAIGQIFIVVTGQILNK